MSANSRFASSLTAAVFFLTFCGCGLLPQPPEGFFPRLSKEWDAVWVVLAGGKSPFAQPTASPSPGPSGEPVYSSSGAQASKANAELLHEMFSVVFNREPRDRTGFGSLVDTLNQGASLEGIYNGYTHSADYRRLEEANQGATPHSVKVFCDLLQELDSALAIPSVFDASAARPLPLPVTPEMRPEGDGVSEESYPGRPKGQASPSSSPTLFSAEKCILIFTNASLYTLKRVLGDEAFKVIEFKAASREGLAQWYSKWVVQMDVRGVDFGIELRNRPDENFHYKWAMSSSQDLLDWEVLNRVHRVLNESSHPSAQKSGVPSAR